MTANTTPARSNRFASRAMVVSRFRDATGRTEGPDVSAKPPSCFPLQLFDFPGRLLAVIRNARSDAQNSVQFIL